MDDSIFSNIDALVVAAGTTNGHELAAFLHIDEQTHSGPFVGYSLKIGFYTTLSVHEDLNSRSNLLVTDHEIMHIVNNDFEDFEETSGAVFDREAYNYGAARRLARAEIIANLGGTDLFIPTPGFLDDIGYNNPSLQAFREYDSEKRDHIRRYQNAMDRWRFCQTSGERDKVRSILRKEQRALKLLEEACEDYASEIQSMNCCFTAEQLARRYRVSKDIINYKMRALQIRGYAVDPDELASFDTLFRNRRG